MIAMLRGIVWQISDNKVILDVNGVGYLVYVPVNCLMSLKKGEEITFYIHLVHKEDDMVLFGFMTSEEKELFIKMIGVSGIGPKAALAILSSYNTGQVKAAIVNEQFNLLTKVQGIGVKTARRLVLDLKEQISLEASEHNFEVQGPTEGFESIEALQSLLALGFSQREAQAAVEKVTNSQGELSTETLVKEALRLLALSQ